MTDVVGNPEEERRADFFYQPWSQEAVCRYFYGKVSFGMQVVMFAVLYRNEVTSLASDILYPFLEVIFHVPFTFCALFTAGLPDKLIRFSDLLLNILFVEVSFLLLSPERRPGDL